MPNMSTQLEVENARNLTVEQLSETFIPTKLFDQLLSPNHHVLLGARGQGKTALFRMLSFDGLSSLAAYDEQVKSLVEERKFIGIYLPTKLEWIQSLALQTDSALITPERAFLWKLNLSSCIALLVTVESCVRYYCQDERSRTVKELSFCRGISDVWHLGGVFDTFKSVSNRLKSLSFEMQIEISRRGMFGSDYANQPLKEPLSSTFAVFATSSFEPMIQGMRLASSELELSPLTSWLLCIDEAEWMSAEQQTVVNSFMRVAPESHLFLKIATMPFSHYTLNTANGEAPLIPGQDFEYVHMDFGGAEVSHVKDAEAKWGREYAFGELLFQKVMARYFPDVASRFPTMTALFGTCALLDRDLDQDWSNNSTYMNLLREYANVNFLSRAEKKNASDGQSVSFMDSIGRKVKGALLLRRDYDNRKGHEKSDLYSGARMIIKCADGNPRVFIRILKKLISSAEKPENGAWQVKQKLQEELLRGLAENFLNQIKSYQNVGPELYQIVIKLGGYMQCCLYKRQLTGDVVGSFSVDEPDKTDYEAIDLLKSAVRYGVIKPNDSGKLNYGGNATLAGDYHLSYTFCPYFRTLPRKGTCVSLHEFTRALELPVDAKKDDPNQMMLWE